MRNVELVLHVEMGIIGEVSYDGMRWAEEFNVIVETTFSMEERQEVYSREGVVILPSAL